MVETRMLEEAFRAAYGREPAVVVRAPGRVNLIGEHTDTSDLPVLPMAIERATYVAAAPAAGNRVAVLSSRFEGPADLAPPWEVPEEAPRWHRYVAGVLEVLDRRAVGRGAQVFIDSDLPTVGGLSSSSALSVGLIAALDAVWDLGLERHKVAELAARAERRLGVETGGMDQTVIVHGRAGMALRIDFAPLRIRPVPLPEEMVLIVASSGRRAPKGGSVREAYNERVVGCRLAAALLAAEEGMLEELLRDGTPPRLGTLLRLRERRQLWVSGLPQRASPQFVARHLGIDLAPLVRLTRGRFDPNRPVPLRPYARHVLGEAARVEHAEAALRRGDLRGFAGWLDASHASLAGDFACSTPEIEHLRAAMIAAGAQGARLTGAGFGGFLLALVPPEQLTAALATATYVAGGPAFRVRPAAGLDRLR